MGEIWASGKIAERIGAWMDSFEDGTIKELVEAVDDALEEGNALDLACLCYTSNGEEILCHRHRIEKAVAPVKKLLELHNE